MALVVARAYSGGPGRRLGFLRSMGYMGINAFLICTALLLVGLQIAPGYGPARTARGGAATERQRVLVLTDISNEPDDEESLVRFLVYANEYDVVTTST